LNTQLPQQHATKTWSQRFESALHPAIARFNASISFDIELIEYDITGSVAHSAHTGIISEWGRLLVTGLEQIRQYGTDNWSGNEEADLRGTANRNGGGKKNCAQRVRAMTSRCRHQTLPA